MRYLPMATTLAAVAILFSDKAQACCPDIGHGPAATGLGASNPQAQNLSAASTVRVYLFERDGLRYLQVNDLNGQARTAIGWIGDTHWVMPIGTDVDRTTILPTGTSTEGTVVYDGNEMTVRLKATSQGDTWLITPKQ